MASSIDILLNGRETVGPAADKAVSGLQRLNDSLHGTEGRLKSFNSVMELAFGFHIGRFFFEQVHQAIGKMTEGFTEAQKAGLGFTESIQDGIGKIFGLKTQAEQLAEAMKKSQEFGKGWLEILEKAQRFQMGVGPDRGPYSGVPGAAAIEKELIDKRDKALEAAKPATEYKPDFWSPFYSQEGIRKKQEEQIAAIRKRYAKQLKDLDFAQNALAGFQQAAGDQQSDYERRNPYASFTTDHPRWTALFNAFTGSLGPATAQSPLASAFNRINESISSTMIDALMGASRFGRRGKEYSELTGQLQAAEVERERLRGLPTQRERELRSVAAQNERFLTRGPGNMQTPEVQATKDVQKAIEAQSKLIDDLKRKIEKLFGQIGVAGA